MTYHDITIYRDTSAPPLEPVGRQRHAIDDTLGPSYDKLDDWHAIAYLLL